MADVVRKENAIPCCGKLNRQIAEAKPDAGTFNTSTQCTVAHKGFFNPEVTEVVYGDNGLKLRLSEYAQAYIKSEYESPANDGRALYVYFAESQSCCPQCAALCGCALCATLCASCRGGCKCGECCDTCKKCWPCAEGDKCCDMDKCKGYVKCDPLCCGICEPGACCEICALDKCKGYVKCDPVCCGVCETEICKKMGCSTEKCCGYLKCNPVFCGLFALCALMCSMFSYRPKVSESSFVPGIWFARKDAQGCMDCCNMFCICHLCYPMTVCYKRHEIYVHVKHVSFETTPDFSKLKSGDISEQPGSTKKAW